MPSCSLQYGLDLTVYLTVIEDPEWMSSRLGHEVCAGVPQNVAGQMIVILDEEETCPECLGSYSEDVLCSWDTSTHWLPSSPLQSTQFLGGSNG